MYKESGQHPIASALKQDGCHNTSRCGVCSSNNFFTSNIRCINNLTHDIETPFNFCNNCKSLFAKVTQGEHDLLEIDNKNYAIDNKAKRLLKQFLIRREIKSARICEGNSLDYGCGNGTLGNTFKKLFPASEITFVDLPKTPAQEMPGKYLSNEAFSESSLTFDNIFLRHVLEHSSEPRALVANLANRLRPKGKLYVWIPNDCSLWKIFGARWPGYYHPYHQYVISHAGIEHIANSTKNLEINKTSFVETPVFGVIISSFARVPKKIALAISVLIYPLQLTLTFFTPKYRESMLVIFEKDE